MNKLKLRFIDDLKHPVSVLEDPYWEYQLGLCPVGKEDWKKLLMGIKEEYDGNYELFLQDFYAIREAMIQTLQGSEKWKEVDMSRFKGEPLGVRSKDIYNEEYAKEGRLYLSLDLKKANIQAFNQVDPELFGGEETWNADVLWLQFIRKHVPEEKILLRWYAEKSKYLRQVVFGNVNPKRQMGIEKWMMAKVNEKMTGVGTLIMAGTDELIYEVRDAEDVKEPEIVGIDVRAKIFRLKSIAFETTNGHTLRVYKREFVGGGEDYKGIPRTYYPQVMNLLKGNDEDPEGRDLAFYYEKEIAKFVGRIKIKEED